MQKTNYYCDGCGKEKGEVNHWFIVRADQEGFTVSPFMPSGHSGCIYCGQSCVIKAFSEYLERCRNKPTEAPIGDKFGVFG